MKLNKFSDVMIPLEVKMIVEECGLLPLGDYLLNMLDDQLLTYLVERWYKETYLFHLLFGEMTITLDDVSSLFHIPLECSFFTAPIISQKTACLTVVEYLGGL